VGQLGANAHGEVLEVGRVPNCYLGLRLDPTDDAEAAGVLVVGPTTLLHPAVPQPDGAVLYELVTGHPDRAPRELVSLPDLTVELRAWPRDTWAKVGIDPQAAARAVVAGWQRGDLLGLRLGGLSVEEALALERPAMTYVRAQLGDRLGHQLAGAYRRWRHPSSGRRPGDSFLSRWVLVLLTRDLLCGRPVRSRSGAAFRPLGHGRSAPATWQGRSSHRSHRY
jgi:hypothetical protein